MSIVPRSTTPMLDPSSIMTEAQARVCIEAIKTHVNCATDQLFNAREQLLIFYRKRGWLALHYTTIKDCFEAEFENHFTYTFRLLAAAQMDERIAAKLAQQGRRYVALPEGLLRELGHLDEGALEDVIETSAAITPEDEAISPEAVREAHALLEGADPERMAEEARQERRKARQRSKKRKQLTARQQSEARLQRASKLLYTAVKWMDREGWTPTDMHEAMDRNIAALEADKEERRKKGEDK